MKFTQRKFYSCVLVLLTTVIQFNQFHGFVHLGNSQSNSIRRGFPLIFPFLTTGWYYKPGPTESLILGLILVKVLALRLASVTGILPIPYHLNDLFVRSLGKRSVRSVENFDNSTVQFIGNTTTTNVYNTNFTILDENEIAIVQRILLGIRRIDSHDCFIRQICQINQNILDGYGTQEDESMLKVLRLKPATNSEEKTIWDIFSEVLQPQKIDCVKKYSLCPLIDEDLHYDKLLLGLF